MSPAGIATVGIFATTPCPFSLAYLNQMGVETAIHFSQRGTIESSRLRTYISIAASIRSRANQTRQSW